MGYGDAPWVGQARIENSPFLGKFPAKSSMIFVKGSSGLGLLVPATLLLHFHTRIPPIYSPSNRDFLVVRCFAIHCEALGLAITQESESWSSTGLKFQDSDNDTKGQSRRIDKSDRNLGNLLQELLTCHRPLLARLYHFLHEFSLMFRIDHTS